MQLEVGDSVQLTGNLLLILRRTAPSVFEKLMEKGELIGRILAIRHNVLRLDVSLDKPLTLTIDGNPHLFVQLIRKHSGAMVGVYEADSGVAAPANFSLAPPDNSLMQSMIDDDDAEDDEDDDDLVNRIRVSQWLINQFLSMKQYGIVQDLHRGSDTGSRPDPRDDNENWNFHGKEFRPVKYELSVMEEKAYNAALAAIFEYVVPHRHYDSFADMVDLTAETPHSDIDPPN